jgi:hypothetical protein
MENKEELKANKLFEKFKHIKEEVDYDNACKRFKVTHNEYKVKGISHLTKKQVKATNELMDNLEEPLNKQNIEAVLTYLDQEIRFM